GLFDTPICVLAVHRSGCKINISNAAPRKHCLIIYLASRGWPDLAKEYRHAPENRGLESQELTYNGGSENRHLCFPLCDALFTAAAMENMVIPNRWDRSLEARVANGG